MILVAVAVCLAAGSLAFAWWSVHRSADRVVAGHVRRVCIVSCKDGATWKGVLFDADARSLLLHDAGLLQGTEFVPVDGTSLIFRSDVGSIQML